MSTRLSRLWYAALVGAFPAEFRNAFGAEVLRVIEEQRAAVAGRGLLSLIACHVEATADLVAALLRERMALVARGAGWALLALALLNIGYDVITPKLSMGFRAWALTMIAIALGILLRQLPPRRRRI